MHTHVIIFSKKCPQELLEDTVPIKKLLTELRPIEGIVQGPLVIRRLSGITGFLVAEKMHFFLCTTATGVTLEVGSESAIEINKYVDAVMRLTKATLQEMSFIEFDKNEYILIECQEPHCVARAVKDYNGMKLCIDHFEQWQERRDDLRRKGENR